MKDHTSGYLTLEEGIAVFEDSLDEGDQYAAAMLIEEFYTAGADSVRPALDESIRRLRDSLDEIEQFNVIDFIDALNLDRLDAVGE